MDRPPFGLIVQHSSFLLFGEQRTPSILRLVRNDCVRRQGHPVSEGNLYYITRSVRTLTTSLKFSEKGLEAESTPPEFTDAKIIIEAIPWVSSETVRKHYRKAQIKVMGTSGGKAPGLKHLRLFRFVTER